jgi:hypothetical protein
MNRPHRPLRLARRVLAVAAPAALVALPLAVMAPGVAGAQTSTTTYQANLQPLNHATGSGTLMLQLSGNQATVTEDVQGLAATFNGGNYPHVQHIHIGGQGMCPSTSADANGDGVISTTEGGPAYGGIGTTLSVSGDTSPAAGTNVTIAPSGAGFHYSRTVTLDSKTLSAVKANNAVIVVHGLDPSTLSQQAQGEKSDLVPSLPLAATSPALCGPLQASQMSQMPNGAASTGGGGMSGIQDGWLFGIGAAGVAGAALFGGVALRRRTASQK